MCVTNTVASNADVAELMWPKSCGQNYVHDQYCGQQWRRGQKSCGQNMCVTNNVASNVRNHVAKNMCVTNNVASNVRNHVANNINTNDQMWPANTKNVAKIM